MTPRKARLAAVVATTALTAAVFLLPANAKSYRIDSSMWIAQNARVDMQASPLRTERQITISLPENRLQ